MENKINKKEENTEGKTEIKAEEMYRISISGAAEKVLAGLAVRVNDGFTGGRVNRSQITNWVLRNQVIRAVIDYAARVLRACSSGVGTCSPRLASLSAMFMNTRGSNSTFLQLSIIV